MQPEGKETFPSQFGRYTLVERLATGGMAEVFRAKIVSGHGFEKRLVIKRILPHLAADKTFVSMFIDEAKLTAQLVHPKIVQVTDFGDVAGQYFIALEYIDGFDALALLRTSAQRQLRIPVPICVFVTTEVLDALDYAHNAKDSEGRPMHLVHRDISPSNVFISHRGDVKLGDFGIAHAQKRESKTQAGTLKGKYGYMSPEQVVGTPIDGRSDIFAVGIVLAEMLMGRRLFTAPNDLDVLLMVRDGRLERLDKYCRDIPPELDRIVRTALKKRAAERYQTTAEFREALGDLMFASGFRVGSADLSRVAKDYFDPSPQALDRLREQAKVWKMRAAATSGVRSAAPEAAGPPSQNQMRVTPAPSSGVSAQKAEWGIDVALVTEQVNPTPGSTPAPGPRPPSGPKPAPGSTPVPKPRSGVRAVDIPIDEPSGAGPAAPGEGGNVLEALDQALSQPLAIVDLDQYTGSSPGLPSEAMAPGGWGGPGPAATEAPPEAAGDLAMISPMRVLADLAVAVETGMVRFGFGNIVKDIYLARGAPESISSNQSADRFGDYLVARGFVRPADLETATRQASAQGGKLGDAIVGLGLMRPLDVFRLAAQHMRERVMEMFAWVQGSFAYYRGRRNPVEALPLGLDSFEILGAGVLTLPYEFLQSRFIVLQDYRPRAIQPPRISLEAFKLGSTSREVWSALDGRVTIREWIGRFASATELLTFLRMLHLLLEANLARLE